MDRAIESFSETKSSKRSRVHRVVQVEKPVNFANYQCYRHSSITTYHCRKIRNRRRVSPFLRNVLFCFAERWRNTNLQNCEAMRHYFFLIGILGLILFGCKKETPDLPHPPTGSEDGSECLPIVAPDTSLSWLFGWSDYRKMMPHFNPNDNDEFLYIDKIPGSDRKSVV